MPAATDTTAGKSQSSQPLPALPSEVLMVAESQWIFTEAELLRTPSINEGVPPEKEREGRSKGVNFILQVGIMLKLPQITLATASVFLHRFYMRHAMDIGGRPGYHYYSMAATSLFLATKVEENCRKMKELVIACVRVAQKDPYKLVDEQDKEYWRWRDNILHHEDLLLEAICFDLSLEPPYKTLFELLGFFGEDNNKRLRNAAWAFVNDSCLTMLCLLFSGRTIATSALYAAAKHSGVAFPDDDRGRPWWESISVDIEEVRRACNYMADLYESIPSKGGKEGGIYERTPEISDEFDDKTRVVGLIAESRRTSAGSVDGEERRPKRGKDGEVGLDDKSHTNGVITGLSNGADHDANGSGDGSPRKRQRIIGYIAQGSKQGANDGQQDSQLTRPEPPTDVVHPDQGPTESGRPEQQIESPRPRDTILSSVQRTNKDHPNGKIERLEEPAEGSGLVSPKLDEVSEEGELEP